MKTSKSSNVLLWRWFISLFSREAPARPNYCAAIRGSQPSAGTKLVQSWEFTLISLFGSNGRTVIPHHLLKVKQVSCLPNLQMQRQCQCKVLRRSDACLMGVDFPTLSPPADHILGFVELLCCCWKSWSHSHTAHYCNCSSQGLEKFAPSQAHPS